MGHALLFSAVLVGPELDFGGYDRPRPGPSTSVLRVRTASYELSVPSEFSSQGNGADMAFPHFLALRRDGWTVRYLPPNVVIIDGKKGEPVTEISFKSSLGIKVPVRHAIRAGMVNKIHPPDGK